MWDCCRMGWGICCQRPLKRPKPSSLQFLLSTLTFRNSKPMRQGTKSKARKPFPHCLHWSANGTQKLVSIHKWFHRRHTLTNVPVRPASIIILERPWWLAMGFLRTGRKQSLPFVVLEDKKNLENYRVSSLPLIPGKVLKQQFQETISRYMKDRKVSSQHEFMKERSCLTNPVASYDEMTSLEDKGWAASIACKAFKTTPSLQTSLMKYMLGKGMLSENCSSCTAGHKGLWSAAQIPDGGWS